VLLPLGRLGAGATWDKVDWVLLPLGKVDWGYLAGHNKLVGAAACTWERLRGGLCVRQAVQLGQPC